MRLRFIYNSKKDLLGVLLKHNIFINVLFIISILLIIHFTMFTNSALSIGTSIGEVNLIPFKNIGNILKSSNPFTEFILNVGGNIVLFIPFGFALPLKYPKFKKIQHVTFSGLSMSLIIECIQLTMPNRWTDIDDVILNTIGTYFGFLLLRKFFK